VAQLVEHHLAKVRVASSNLVIRSTKGSGAQCVGAFVFSLLVSDPWGAMASRWVEAGERAWPMQNPSFGIWVASSTTEQFLGLRCQEQHCDLI
jgi:hypothetical protein